MGVFKKKYRNCSQGEDGTIECMSYIPTKDGNKIPTAMLIAKKTPDCKAFVLSEDGDPNDINDLVDYLGKTLKVKCSPNKTI